jgi:RimJ/RimL family protein N-acetyltransferase
MKPFIEPFSHGAIKLRLLEERDLDAILEWRNRDDARIWFKTSDRVTPKCHRTWYARYLGKDDDLVFVIEVSGVGVGMCAIYDIDRGTDAAQLGRFLIAPEFSGMGYIKRACAALMSFAIKNLHLHYLFLEVMENNTRALSIYKACGFREEVRKDGLIRMSFERRE